MNTKSFIIRFIVIFICTWIILSLALIFIQMNIADYHYSGFPLKYSEGGGMCVEGPCPTNFYLSNLIINIIIWIAVSIGITFLSYKIKK